MEKLFDFIIQFIDLFRFWVVMERPENGWVFTWGKTSRFITWKSGWFGTGLHLIVPFGVEECISQPDWEEWAKLPVQSITTADGHAMSIQGTFRYKVLSDDKDKLLAFITECGENDNVINGGFEGAIATIAEISKRDEMIDPEKGAIPSILDQARRNLNRYGLKIFEFQWVQKSVGRQYRVIM